MSKETQTGQKPKLVSDIMSKKVVSVNADAPILELAKEMSSKNISSIILSDNDGSDIGIVTERDLTREVCAKDILASGKVGRSIMSSNLITINEDASVEWAAETMVKNRLRHLLVKDSDNIHNSSDYHNKIIGLVTTTDIAKYLREKIQPSATTSDPDEILWEAVYLANGGNYDEQC